MTRRHRLRTPGAPRSRMLLLGLAGLAILFIIGSFVVATLRQDEAQVDTAIAEDQRDATAAQAQDLAAQIQTACTNGTLSGPICVRAAQVAADPVPGPSGPRGDAGAAGVAGPAGLSGTPGVAGSAGPPGVRGEPGPPGRDGINGANGGDGVNGIDGTDGADGMDGAPGAPGESITGPAGPGGSAGPTGPQGDTGPAGPSCPPGEEPAQVTYRSGETGTACVLSPEPTT